MTRQHEYGGDVGQVIQHIEEQQGVFSRAGDVCEDAAGRLEGIVNAFNYFTSLLADYVQFYNDSVMPAYAVVHTKSEEACSAFSEVFDATRKDKSLKRTGKDLHNLKDWADRAQSALTTKQGLYSSFLNTAQTAGTAEAFGRTDKFMRTTADLTRSKVANLAIVSEVIEGQQRKI